MAGGIKRQLSRTSIIYIAVGVLLITLMTIIGMSAFLRVKEIVVEGTAIYTADDVIKASGLAAGDNLMFVNVQVVSQKIRDELPFAGHVNISKVLPDKINIEITESIAIATIAYAGEIYVIDSACRVLARLPIANPTLTGVDIDSLVEIRGSEIEETSVGNVLRPVFGAETKLQYIQDVLITLQQEELADDVSYLDVSNIMNVFLYYMGRYRVILGGSTSMRPSNLRYNLGRLTERVKFIELSFPNTSGDIDMSDINAEPVFRPSQ